MLNVCDFIQVYVFTTNHHLNSRYIVTTTPPTVFHQSFQIFARFFFMVCRAVHLTLGLCSDNFLTTFFPLRTFSASEDNLNMYLVC